MVARAEMSDVPVCVIGCGPIGLAMSLLLSRHGVRVLVVERRSELNTHPRSRFVDTNTMELMREFGLEKMVEATGLGPDWTAYNRWSDNLAVEPFAELESPTFLSVKGGDSPCLPVMTVQDEVEKALMSRVEVDPDIDVQFDTEVIELSQTEDKTTLVLRDTTTDQCRTGTANYTVGADGPGSTTRAVIGTYLDGSPQPRYMQDVIFHADLSAYVGDRRGALLYTQPPEGVVIFQPLDGRRRWRCQVAVGEEKLIPEDAIRVRIAAALGTSDDVDLDIVSMRMWQPTPGCVTTFSEGRIFLAGDAAHVSVPTGGLGNNAGFSGARNLAWKLAYVLRGLAPATILETYDEEHRPVALERIRYGVVTTEYMARMMLGHASGDDVSEHIEGTKRYADYDYLLRGYELSSDLIAANPGPAPVLASPAAEFRPLLRNGWRAPHVWVDDGETQSALDWYGRGFVLVLGPECDSTSWEASIRELPDGGVPLTVRQLPNGKDIGPYEPDGVVLVRPDAVIAQNFRTGGGPADLSDIVPYLPSVVR